MAKVTGKSSDNDNIRVGTDTFYKNKYNLGEKKQNHPHFQRGSDNEA